MNTPTFPGFAPELATGYNHSIPILSDLAYKAFQRGVDDHDKHGVTGFKYSVSRRSLHILTVTYKRIDVSTRDQYKVIVIVNVDNVNQIGKVAIKHIQFEDMPYVTTIYTEDF